MFIQPFCEGEIVFVVTPETNAPIQGTLTCIKYNSTLEENTYGVEYSDKKIYFSEGELNYNVFHTMEEAAKGLIKLKTDILESSIIEAQTSFYKSVEDLDEVKRLFTEAGYEDLDAIGEMLFEYFFNSSDENKNKILSKYKTKLIKGE